MNKEYSDQKAVEIVTAEFDRLGILTVPAYTDYTVCPPVVRVTRSVEIEGPKGRRDICLMTNEDGSSPAAFVVYISRNFEDMRGGDNRGLLPADVFKLQKLQPDSLLAR